MNKYCEKPNKYCEKPNKYRKKRINKGKNE
jgi:hypothetical protein